MLRLNFRKRPTTKTKQMRKSYIQRLWKCPYCEKSVSNANVLFHALVHSLEKPFQCFECRERFADEDIFDDHMREHEMNRITQNRELSEQQRKSFKKFRKANKKREAELKQADTKPEVVVQTTTTRSGRVVRQTVRSPTIIYPRRSGAHMYSKQSMSNFSSKKLKTIKQNSTDEVLTDGLVHCGHCPKTFLRLSNLKVHMKNYHNPQIATSIIKLSKLEATQERKCFANEKKISLRTSKVWKRSRCQSKAKNSQRGLHKNKNGKKVQKPSAKVNARANKQHEKVLVALNSSRKLMVEKSKERRALLSLCDRRQHEPSQCDSLFENPASILGFQCQRCPARFLNLYEYHVHVADHEGHPKFNCDICQTGFLTQSHLETHLNAFHSVTAN